MEDQLRETQVAKDELERQQRELQEMMERLEASKNLEAEERARLEEEIYCKRDEVGMLCQNKILLWTTYFSLFWILFFPNIFCNDSTEML